MTMQQHLPCPCGQSSDAFCLYEDGGWCFSGDCKIPSWNLEELRTIGYKVDRNVMSANIKRAEYMQPNGGAYKAIKDRGITAKTCKKYGVLTKMMKDQVLYNLPYFNNDGIQVGNKIKKKSPKAIWWNKTSDVENCLLFGQNLFSKGGKYITITEGELDALAAFQLLGNQWPVVSVKNGSGDVNSCKKQYEYLNSFDNIVICFDNDTPGVVGANKIARLFPGKAKIMSMKLHKDACQYQEAKDLKEFNNEWWAAKTYTLEGFVTGTRLRDVARRQLAKGLPLVWDSLSEKTYGIRKHELWFFTGGTGMGKSELLKEIAYDFIVNKDVKVGMLMLEETPALTAQCLYGKDMGKRLYLEENFKKLEEIETAPNLENIEKNLVIVEHKGNSDFNSIVKKMEYMIAGLGCEYIFYDHFTASAEGKEDSSNNRVHGMMESLNQLYQSMNASLLAISHLRKSTSGASAEEGGRVTLDDIYGSAAIKQRSNFVFALEGNLQAEGPERNRRILRCLKDRNTGRAAGEFIHLEYDQETGRLNEFDIDFMTGE